MVLAEFEVTVVDWILACFVSFVLMVLTDNESFADTGFLAYAEILKLKHLLSVRNQCLVRVISSKE